MALVQKPLKSGQDPWVSVGFRGFRSFSLGFRPALPPSRPYFRVCVSAAVFCRQKPPCDWVKSVGPAQQDTRYRTYRARSGLCLWSSLGRYPALFLGGSWPPRLGVCRPPNPPQVVWGAAAPPTGGSGGREPPRNKTGGLGEVWGAAAHQ